MTATPTRSSTTKKSTKNALVPRLRFPEFEGEWDVRSLSDLFGKITNGKANAQDHVSHGKYPLFDRSTEIKKSNKFEYEGRAVIIPGEGMRFQPRYFEGKFDLHQRTYALLESRESILFLFYGIAHRKTALSEKAVQSTVRSLRLPIVRKFKIPVPSLPEQQKIADCLSSLDDLITAESEKLETLKVHKKGLMQELFPREGETTPRIRFPEFEGSGEWEVKRLGELTSKVGSGKTPRGGEATYQTSGRPFVRSQNVDWGTLVLDDIAFIDDEMHSTFLSTEIHKNDVLLNITGASIGRSAIADDRIVGGNVNQHVCIIRTKKRTLLPTYLSQFLLTDLAQRQIDSFQAGGNRQGLNFNQIRSFLIPISPLLSEQQKIASVLSSLDDRIAAQTQQIEILQAHKKGLMQQLFPVIEK